MSHSATELTIQRIKNESADKTVSPVIPREGMLGQDSGGIYRNISVNTSGEWIIDPTNLDTRYAKLDLTNQPFKPLVDSTTAFQIQQADTTPVFNVDTTNRKIIVSSGTSGQSIIGSGLVVNNDAGNATQDDFTVKSNTLTVITVDASADALGFFNATPVSQQLYTAISNPPTQAEVTAIRDALVNLGLMASS